MIFFKRSKTSIKVLTRDPLKLRLYEWRSDEALVSRAIQLARNPDFRLMLDVLQNEHPGNVVLMEGCGLDTRAAHQARCEGYTMALANLQALSNFDPLPQSLEATFEDEQKE